MSSIKFLFLSLCIALLSYFFFPDFPSHLHVFKQRHTAPPISPISTLPANCTSPTPRTCTFYRTCLEAHFHCGPAGYPLSFGEKFCSKFSLSSNADRLTPAGQKWMYDTMHCLQLALVPQLQLPAPTTSAERMASCKKLEDKAFSTHAPCYLSSGLCKLPPEDWVVIVEIIRLKTLVQSWEAFESSLQAEEGCLKFFEWVVVHRVEHGL